MKQRSVSAKIAIDMFAVQMGWALWYLGIVTMIQIVRLIFSAKNGSRIEDFFLSTGQSANIFMFVLGILAVYAFMPAFIRNGVTRKEFFKGGIAAAAGLALALPLIAGGMALAERSLVRLADLPVSYHSADMIDSGGDSPSSWVRTIIRMIIVPVFDIPLADLQENGLLAIALHALNLAFFYLSGWLIGAGFYRYGGPAGLGFIVLALFFFHLRAFLWKKEAAESLKQWLPVDTFSIPLPGFIFASLALIFIMAWLIRLLTRRVAVKL
ncbi:hypothetical protein [Caldibacillus debilis]|uniref:hypothetical protein n=1 Tax=Caldibacillus debilis TaxID=301148 RepID=UPI000E381A17|nr:hypothetical protein [Caldibacillus debilis]REJ22114.1 MAG: hypothetical protein C6W56_16550 [Caldibacillus debilis]